MGLFASIATVLATGEMVVSIESSHKHLNIVVCTNIFAEINEQSIFDRDDGVLLNSKCIHFYEFTSKRDRNKLIVSLFASIASVLATREMFVHYVIICAM